MPQRPRAARCIAGWSAMLLVAATINVLVAWACALWSPVAPWITLTSYERDLPIPPSAAAVATFRLDRIPADWERDPGAFTRSQVEIELVSGFGVRQTVLTLNEFDRNFSWNPTVAVGAVCVVDCGWPLHGLTATHERLHPGARKPRTNYNHVPPLAQLPDSPENWRGAFQAPPWLATNPVQPVSGAPWFPIPYAIRPLAFALNTLFWLAVIAVPGPILRAARRRLRTRRGLCPACAYDLQDLPTCPECGTPHPTRPATTAPQPQ